jgi:hypothetical protein
VMLGYVCVFKILDVGGHPGHHCRNSR